MFLFSSRLLPFARDELFVSFAICLSSHWIRSFLSLSGGSVYTPHGRYSFLSVISSAFLSFLYAHQAIRFLMLICCAVVNWSELIHLLVYLLNTCVCQSMVFSHSTLALSLPLVWNITHRIHTKAAITYAHRFHVHRARKSKIETRRRPKRARAAQEQPSRVTIEANHNRHHIEISISRYSLRHTLLLAHFYS